MSNYFIFEDNVNSPVSHLLASSSNGESYIFSGGSYNILKTVMSVYTKEDEFYVFFDVVPNNVRTKEAYEIFRLTVNEKKLSNVHVIPIICIEYYVLRMLTTYNYISNNELIRGVVFNFDSGAFTNYVTKIGCNPSVEKVCKTMLRNLHKVCMHNESREKNPLYGLFYMQDCKCEERYCSVSFRDCLKLKSERMCCTLPVFDVENKDKKTNLEGIGINTVEVTISDVIREQKALYNSITLKLGLPNAII